MREGKALGKKIFILPGAYKTVQMGSGRKDFSPKAKRPSIEELMHEAGTNVLKELDQDFNDEQSVVAQEIDSGHLGNFQMPLYCKKQAHRSGLIASIHPDLEGISASGYEGACASGGLAFAGAMNGILSGQSDVSLVVGAEVQNSVKAVYGADYLAGAGHIAGQRKDGHAHFFPGMLGERVDYYNEEYGEPEMLRKAMTEWVLIAYNNGEIDTKSQVYDHGLSDEKVRSLAERVNPKKFVPNLSVLDCSKVTDAAAAFVLASEDGIERLRDAGVEIDDSDLVEIVGLGQAGRDITQPPSEGHMLKTSAEAVRKAYESAGLTAEDIGLVEVHDCFSNIGIMMLEAGGFAPYGEGCEFVLAGKTRRDGELPTNPFGGLISGHPVGETGVRQAVDIYNQLTEKAGPNQITINPDKRYALSINMGGDDGTVVATIYKRAA